MKASKSLIISILLVLLGTIFLPPDMAHAYDYPAEPDLTIGLAADTHDNLARLQNFVTAMNSWQPDFVVELGDYATDDPLEYPDLQAIFNTLTMSGYHVRGNHDTPAADWLTAVGAEDYYYSWDYGDYHFVVLDNGSYWASTHANQLTWLASDLAATDKPTFVFTHIPLSPFWDINGTSARTSHDSPETRDILEADGDVVAVFDGHIHPTTGDTMITSANGITYYSISALYLGDNWAKVSIWENGVVQLEGVGVQSSYGAAWGSWWNGSWTERKVLSLDTSTLSNDLYDFPVRVVFDSTNFDFSEAQANGEDIRFIGKDSYTQLPYEIERWDSVNEIANVWVKVPKVAAGLTYSDYIYAYWGNGVVADGQSSEDVWGGYVDLTNADATSNNNGTWTGTSISLDGAVKKEGTSSIKDTIAAPVGGNDYTTTFTSLNWWDLSRDGQGIDFWLRSDRASAAFNSARVYLSTVDMGGASLYWDLTFSANTWTHVSKLLSSATLVGAPDDNMLANITTVKVVFNAADGVAFTKNIDWMELRWGAQGVWHYGGWNGAVTIEDSSRYSNDGTMAGNTAWLWQNGAYWLDLDGNNDYVTTGTDLSMDLTQGSYLAWVQADAATAGVVFATTSGVDTGIQAYIPYAGALAYMFNLGGTRYRVGASYTAGNEARFMFVFDDPTHIYVYKNGASAGGAITSAAAAHSYSGFVIGARAATYTGDWTGQVAMVRVYNAILGADWALTDEMNRQDSLLYYGDEDPPPTVTTLAASGISMDKDGVTAATVNGNLSSLGGTPTVNGWFEYGLTIAYGSTTASLPYNTTGIKTANLPNNLTPGATYHFRFVAENAEGITYGADEEFTFTMPTVSTTLATGLSMSDHTYATLNANISDMGVASDTYAYLEWGKSTSYGTNTTVLTRGATGAYSADLSGIEPDLAHHFRAVVRVGATYSYGSDATFLVSGTPLFNLNNYVIPIVWVSVIIVGLLFLFNSAESVFVMLIVGTTLIYLGNAFLQGIVEAIRNLW